MTPIGANYALIGQSYPSEAFALLSQMTQSARERRKTTKSTYRPRDQDPFKRMTSTRQDPHRLFARKAR